MTAADIDETPLQPRRIGVRCSPGSSWCCCSPRSTALTDLREKGLADESRTLTPAGRSALDRLVTARRAALGELLADWSPERHAHSRSISGVWPGISPLTRRRDPLTDSG